MYHVYFHIDLNAFFANAEVLLNPELKGKPIVISGATRRSVVSTASYEARAFGIHSAMPVSEAQKFCRELIIVEGHYTWYRNLSERFMEIVRSYTNLVEQASVDECYADMTEAIKKFEKPLDLAWSLQKQIYNELGLTCSIGVAPNMFLAKMASDMKKPNGITVLRIRDVQEKMWPLPIKDMRGIGTKTVPYMQEIGIRTIGDLANFKDISKLRELLGKNTDDFIERANGIDHRELETEWDAKSMGISETLLEDINEYEELSGLIRTLARTLSKRLKNASKVGSSIHIRICYYDFRNITRAMKLSTPIWRADEIYNAAIALFEDNWEEGEAVRLLGITVGDFADESYISSQLNLFDETAAFKAETKDIINDLNDMLGLKKAFVRASNLLKENTHEDS